MSRYLMTIRYDGTNYHGWQVQNNAVTVQQTVQDSLESLFKIRPNVTGCSRTDSGVHAENYSFHFDFNGNIPPPKIVLGLNTKLPNDICARECIIVPDDFHARYCVKSKRYVYRIYTGAIRDPFLCKFSYHAKCPLDTEKMKTAVIHFLGTHDFTSFCASGSSVEDNTRTVYNANITENGDIIEFSVEADGFLYNMVRIMAGTLIAVGNGKIAPEDITTIIEKKDRASAGVTAPAYGLFLNKVNY